LDWAILVVRRGISSLLFIQLDYSVIVSIQLIILVNLPISPVHISTFPIGRRWIVLNNLGNPLVHAIAILAIAFTPSAFRVTVRPFVLTKFICLKGVSI
jgi:hypothetical protein